MEGLVTAELGLDPTSRTPLESRSAGTISGVLLMGAAVLRSVAHRPRECVRGEAVHSTREGLHQIRRTHDG